MDCKAGPNYRVRWIQIARVSGPRVYRCMFRAAFALVLLFAVACGEPQRVPVNPPNVVADSGVAAPVDTGIVSQTDGGMPGEPDADLPTEDDAGMMGEPDAMEMNDAGTPSATWDDVQSILSARCRNCHDGSRGTWDVTDPADIIGVNSAELPALQRIEAGSSERSFLFRKISGTQAAACTENGSPTRNCGARMPTMAAMLSATNINIIKSWIEEGAIVE
jgi:hypothetical protein